MRKRERKSLIEINRCYFCDTPFEVFTCLHIELHENNNADLYIIDSFEYYDTLVERVSFTNVFRKVIPVREKRWFYDVSKMHSKVQIGMNILKTYLHMNKNVHLYFDTTVYYKNIFYSCHLISVRLVDIFCSIHDIKSELCMFDEGVGSYTSDYENIGRLEKLFRWIIGARRKRVNGIPLYLYRPKLYINYDKCRERLRQIPFFDDIDYKSLFVYKQVFLPSDSISESYIYFETCREEICKTEYASKEMQRYFDMIEETINPANMVVKQHPRARIDYPHKCGDYPRSKFPIEVDFLNMGLDKKVLITYYSTAVITPKIIFDREPIVLLLYKLDYGSSWVRDEVLGVFEKVKAMYRNDCRFFIPSNEQELYESLRLIEADINA